MPETDPPAGGAAPRRRPRVPVGVVARGYAAAVVWLRFPIVAAWIAAAAFAALHLPAFGSSSGPVVQLIPHDAPALRALVASTRIFRLPAGSDYAVVVRDPGGLSSRAHAAVLADAVAVDRHPSRNGAPAFAVPLLDTLDIVPGSKDPGTTAVTYLYYPPAMPLGLQLASAHGYARTLARHAGIDATLTGALPGQAAQGVIIDGNLDLVEIITLIAVCLIVALAYRSVAAPLVTLAGIAIAFPITILVLDRATHALGIVVPQELDPVVVALLLGIVTDYSIFFLSGIRTRRAMGDDRLAATRATTAGTSPILLTSGLILTCGLLGLLASSLGFFRTLGPALAITVAAALVVSLTLLPALLAIIGRIAYWPRTSAVAPETAEPGRPSRRYRLAYLMASRPAALVVAAGCIALLAVAAVQMRDLRLGFGQISDLPASSGPNRGARGAAQGFAPGILAPTTVLVQQPGVAAGTLHDRLSQLESAIERSPGVAGVLGPREQPTPAGFGVFLAPGGGAARIVVVLRNDPLSAAGIHDLQRLEAAMPHLAAAAGLGGARLSYAGETALADDTVTAIHHDIFRVAAVVVAANLLLLMIFLRGITAPLFLLGSSAIAVAAALGITTWVFQTALGYHQIAYYVPFAVAVLLTSLGSDYNVFVVGRIWQEARVRPLREAVAVAAPGAARTIRTAGITLAASFATLAVIPLRSFREVAFAMVVGLLLETLVVRSLLVPALISLFGETSGWPGKQLRRTGAEPGVAAAGAAR